MEGVLKTEMWGCGEVCQVCLMEDTVMVRYWKESYARTYVTHLAV